MRVCVTGADGHVRACTTRTHHTGHPVDETARIEGHRIPLQSLHRTDLLEPRSVSGVRVVVLQRRVRPRVSLAQHANAPPRQPAQNVTERHERTYLPRASR